MEYPTPEQNEGSEKVFAVGEYLNKIKW